MQLSTANRVGRLQRPQSVDPTDDCTFWYTNEYYTAASQASSTVGWLTQIGTFTLPGCTPVQTGKIVGTVRNALSGLPIPGATVQTATGLIRVTDPAGTYDMIAAVGSYNMTASATNYLSDSASGVSVSAGGTTVQDFYLTPVPVIQTAPGAAVTAEGCGTGNGAIDPGEAVTVSLPLRNVGTADTFSLVATLLAGGGVTSPGAAQNYGVVLAGGPAVARSFSFIAGGSCGGTVTATLQLQDGSSNLGTVSYSFTLGALNPIPQTSPAAAATSPRRSSTSAPSTCPS